MAKSVRSSVTRRAKSGVGMEVRAMARAESGMRTLVPTRLRPLAPLRKGDTRRFRQVFPRALPAFFVVAARAAVAVEDLLPDTHGVRRDLGKLVAVDELERRVDREEVGRREDHVFVTTRRANVRELLLARDVHVEVVRAVVLADDHAFVHLDARTD